MADERTDLAFEIGAAVDDLIAFLRAREAEREAKANEAARDAGEPTWSAGNEHLSESVHTSETGVVLAYGPYGGLSWEMRQFIADNDPARVLAEVDAKRRIIDAYELATRAAVDDPLNDEAVFYAKGLERSVLLLALPHAGHPDYREHWRSAT